MFVGVVALRYQHHVVWCVDFNVTAICYDLLTIVQWPGLQNLV